MPKTRLLLIPALGLVLAGAAGDLPAQTLATARALPGKAARLQTARALRDALGEVEKKYNVFLMYESTLVENKFVETKSGLSGKVEKALGELLKPFGLTFEKLENDVYLLQPGEKPARAGKASPVGVQPVGPATPLSSPAGSLPGLTLPAGRVAATVSGRVTDGQTGGGLPGVSVVVKGTTTGTATDQDGAYSLAVPGDGATLVFSFIGYVTEEVAVGSRSVVDVSLVPDVKSLSEVVVVGYGTQRKRDITGSVASVSGQTLTSVPAAGLDQALQGRLAGVQVQSATGAPGGTVSIRIRGASSLQGSNEPLYVLDGVPLFGDDKTSTGNLTPAGGLTGGNTPSISLLATLNPNDIETIEVLKDASATAIYGARAANGVVLITTKRGKAGRSNLTLDAYYGVQEPTRYIPMQNAWQYVEMNQDARLNYGQNPQPLVQIGQDSLRGLLGGTNGTDWQREAFRIAPMYNLNLAGSGGTENIQYAISGGWFRQEGVVETASFNRYSLRTNVDGKFGSRFKMGTSLAGSYQEGNMLMDNFWFKNTVLGLLRTSPLQPVYHPTFGGYSASPNGVPGNFGNPYFDIVNDHNEMDRIRFTGNLYGELTLAEGLTLRSVLGSDLVFNKQFQYAPIWERYRWFYPEANGVPEIETQPVASIQINNTYIRNLLNDEILNYTRTFGTDHNLSALLGFSVQSFYTESLYNAGGNISSNSLLTLGNSPAGSRFTVNTPTASGLLSYFGRVTYAFRDKYLFTGTVRRDGSSRFGQNNRYGTFPSASVGWVVSEEGFMAGLTHTVSSLKLRASYGVTGNQDIGNFRYLGLTGGTGYSWNNTGTDATAPVSLSNPDLRWESNQQVDVGLDLELLKGRVSVTADYYVKTAKDLLLTVPLPQTTGVVQDITTNIGSVRNSGFEFALNTTNKLGPVDWNTSFNFATLKNQVLDLGANGAGARNEYPGLTGVFQTSGENITLTREGGPISAFYGYEVEGIFQNEEEAFSHARPSWWTGNPLNRPTAGDVKYKDQNGDGVIDAKDRKILGNPLPDWYGGLQNTFGYRGFSLDVFLNWQVGNEIYNYAKQSIDRGDGFGNHTREFYDSHWRQDRPGDTHPRAAGAMPYHNAERVSSRWVEDGSFLRVRTISLAYDLNKLVKITGMTRSRLYVSVANAFTFTRYTGYDPEVSSVSQNSLAQGVDLGGHPNARIYTVGLNLGF